MGTPRNEKGYRRLVAVRDVTARRNEANRQICARGQVLGIQAFTIQRLHQKHGFARTAFSATGGVADYNGILQIGELLFPCAVLSDGTRVLTQSDFMEGMGMYYSGWVAKNRSQEDRAADVPHFLGFKNLKPFIDKHLGDLQSIVVKYRTTKGTVALGIRAEIIPKICEIWIDADEQSALGSRQKQIAAKASASSEPDAPIAQ